MIEITCSDRIIRMEEKDLLIKLLEKKQKQKKTSHIVKLRCGIYARKSQEDTKDTSLNAQINYCKKIIDSCDILECVEIYQEDNVSGMWDDRKEFQKMVCDIKNQVIDIVVCYKWNRFSRKTSDAERYYQEIVSNNGYIITGDSLMIIDSAQALYFQTMLWANEEYQARLAAETTMQHIMQNLETTNKYIAR